MTHGIESVAVAVEAPPFAAFDLKRLPGTVSIAHSNTLPSRFSFFTIELGYTYHKNAVDFLQTVNSGSVEFARESKDL